MCSVPSRSFYASAPEVSRQAFHTFVQRSFARYPGLRALSLALRVPDAQREAYEQTVRREGFTDFQIKEQTAPGALARAARRPEYIAVTYLEPRAGNEAVLGLDAASVPDRREAVQQARDTGQPTATGRLSLVQDPGRSSGLLIFLPLYSPTLPHATLEERRQNLYGYVIGVFQIDDIVEAALQGLEREGIVLWIEDETAPVERRMLYDNRIREPEDLGPAREAAREASHVEALADDRGAGWSPLEAALRPDARVSGRPAEFAIVGSAGQWVGVHGSAGSLPPPHHWSGRSH